MRWKKEEIEYLKENYPTEKSISEIIAYLKRSRKAIRHKAARLELSRPNIPHNKPKNKKHRKIYDKDYYERHKKRIYRLKKERVIKKKKDLAIVLGGKCQNCGYNKCIWALDFHHKNGDKEECISKLISDFSKEKALKEVKKCILLCANCHRELHYGEKYKG